VKKIVTVGVILLAAACGRLQGEVVGKNYQPSWTSYEQRAIYNHQCTTVPTTTRVYNSSTKSYSTSYGTRQSCHDVWAGTHTVPVFHASCAELKVKDDKGKIKTRCVSERRFYSVEVGQRYDSEAK
jgi:hypothetical protein